LGRPAERRKKLLGGLEDTEGEEALFTEGKWIRTLTSIRKKKGPADGRKGGWPPESREKREDSH